MHLSSSPCLQVGDRVLKGPGFSGWREQVEWAGRDHRTPPSMPVFLSLLGLGNFALLKLPGDPGSYINTPMKVNIEKVLNIY